MLKEPKTTILGVFWGKQDFPCSVSVRKWASPLPHLRQFWASHAPYSIIMGGGVKTQETVEYFARKSSIQLLTEEFFEFLFSCGSVGP